MPPARDGLRIWIEPEAVGPSAIIRHEHPEWIHNVGGLTPPADQRAILNLGVPDARAWIRQRMIALVLSTGARWLKWDFNIDLFQGGWDRDCHENLRGKIRLSRITGGCTF